jgi:hypothetical protein
MRESDILALRLERQLVQRPASAPPLTAESVVSRLCAMQAQDYNGALWSVGLRAAPGTALRDVEKAIAERSIVRTWPMRGTLHFVAPADVRWLLALLAPRVLARARSRHAELGLTVGALERADVILREALSGGRALTRAEAMAALEADGIDTSGQRGYHVLWTLAQRAVLCCGPMAGKQQTFVLLDEWVPPTGEHPLERPAALARLAARYFEAHGPATVADFAWWAGITKTDARAGVAEADALQRLVACDTEYWLPAEASIETKRASASVRLLPGFDEYFLGYTDRALQLGEHRETYGATVAANGAFSSTLVIDGRVAGTWKRTARRDRVDIAVRAFRALAPAEERGLAEAAERYGRFLGLAVNVGT